MKRPFLVILICLIISACTPKAAEKPADLTPVNVCYSALSGSQAVTWYAYENGLFEKYGLQVNLVSMSGGTAAISSLVSGDMDICQAAATSVVNAAAADQDIVIIAGLINKVVMSLMAQPEITSTEMLRGKTIGIDLGGSTDATARLVLQNMNINPDQDVVMLNIGGTPEKMAALEAKQIDATFIGPPYAFELRNKGFLELFNVGNAKIPYQHTSIVTSRKFLAENRPLVADFMKAILEAIKRIKSDPEGSKAVIAKYLSLDPAANADSLQETYDVILMNALEDVPYPTSEGIQVVIDIAAQENAGVVKVKPEDVVDASILKELDVSGFISV